MINIKKVQKIWHLLVMHYILTSVHDENWFEKIFDHMNSPINIIQVRKIRHFNLILLHANLTRSLCLFRPALQIDGGLQI